MRIGPADIHDGTIVDMDRSDDSLEVRMRSYEGRLFPIVFDGVTEVEDNRAVGMMLYALIEQEAEGSRWSSPTGTMMTMHRCGRLRKR